MSFNGIVDCSMHREETVVESSMEVLENTLQFFSFKISPLLKEHSCMEKLSMGLLIYYIFYNWHLVTVYLVIVKQVRISVVFLVFKDKVVKPIK